MNYIISQKQPLGLGFGFRDSTKPTAPGLEKAHQGQHGAAPILLPPHLSDLAHPMELKSGLFFPVMLNLVGPVVL